MHTWYTLSPPSFKIGRPAGMSQRIKLCSRVDPEAASFPSDETAMESAMDFKWSYLSELEEIMGRTLTCGPLTVRMSVGRLAGSSCPPVLSSNDCRSRMCNPFLFATMTSFPFGIQANVSTLPGIANERCVSALHAKLCGAHCPPTKGYVGHTTSFSGLKPSKLSEQMAVSSPAAGPTFHTPKGLFPRPVEINIRPASVNARLTTRNLWAWWLDLSFRVRRSHIFNIRKDGKLVHTCHSHSTTLYPLG